MFGHDAAAGWTCGAPDTVMRPSLQPDELIVRPVRRHFRIILALLSAASLTSRERSLRDHARDQQHVAQVEPVDPPHVESLAVARRQVAEISGHAIDLAQCALEFGLVA